jgi:hypothetical protein
VTGEGVLRNFAGVKAPRIPSRLWACVMGGASARAAAFQYSFGSKNVVTLRSYSVITQSVLAPNPLHGFERSIG